MKVASLFPIVEGYKDSIGAGLRLNLADHLRQDQLSIAASYTPDEELDSDEKVHLDIELDHWNWLFRGTWNRADFYDLFGPTELSRRGWSVGYEFKDILVYDDPRFYRLETGGEHWGDLETLPNYQNVDATAPELTTAWAKIEFDHLRRSLGAAEDVEKGLKWELEGVLDYVNSDTIPRLLGDPRPRLQPAAQPLFDLASRRRRVRLRRRRRRLLPLLLRRVRQQLRRPRDREALPRVLRVSRTRDQRGRRPQLRQGDAGVDAAAGALPQARRSAVLPELGPPGAVRRGDPHRPRSAATWSGRWRRWARSSISR